MLVSSLPAALLTDAGPDRYTVEAVFTRRPDHEEVAGILGNETRTFLTDRGYSTIELKVSDRRLEIANTNLEELRDGLGGILGELLADISIRVKSQRVIATARSQLAAELEQDRATAVVRLAESVVFSVPSERPNPARVDEGQPNSWEEEGGAAARGRIA
ncbi:hypothetical protein [Planctomonas sp. JC2975]|uniref:hypothetical protein n=1 Tax=Planctomonas sp. JC2975 TaxID=2729626 RepID=UPI003211F518